MSEVRADVANAFEDPTGVVFHVEMPGRRVKVHVTTEALAELGAGQDAGERSAFVQENQPAMQHLVDEGVESGWESTLDLMV
jgi:hypothetical protein